MLMTHPALTVVLDFNLYQPSALDSNIIHIQLLVNMVLNCLCFPLQDT